MENTRAEITKLRNVTDAFHSKHKEMSAEIGTARDLQPKHQSEIKRLAGTEVLVEFFCIIPRDVRYIVLDVFKAELGALPHR